MMKFAVLFKEEGNNNWKLRSSEFYDSWKEAKEEVRNAIEYGPGRTMAIGLIEEIFTGKVKIVSKQVDDD